MACLFLKKQRVSIQSGGAGEDLGSTAATWISSAGPPPPPSSLMHNVSSRVLWCPAVIIHRPQAQIQSISLFLFGGWLVQANVQTFTQDFCSFPSSNERRRSNSIDADDDYPHHVAKKPLSPSPSIIHDYNY